MSADTTRNHYGHLVLNVKPGKPVTLTSPAGLITIHASPTSGGSVRLAIDAPKSVNIRRSDCKSVPGELNAGFIPGAPAGNGIASLCDLRGPIGLQDGLPMDNAI